MYIKTKKVRLKNGRVQKYYYIAMSIRLDKNHVRPEIIKYLGKEVSPEVLEWLGRKNKWLEEHREEKRQCHLSPLMKQYEEESGKYAFWHGRVTEQFKKWRDKRIC